MESKKAKLDRLAIALSVFKDYVAIQNGAFLFDSNRLAEGLMEDLLPLLSDWVGIKNLNDEIPNHPAIDLITEDKKIGIQVTATRDISKVKTSIEKFIALEEPPEELYILMICGRQDKYDQDSIAQSVGASTLKFDQKKNIIDLSDLHRWAQDKDVNNIEAAVLRLEAELGKRAFDLLSRFNTSSDRVLRVFESHGISPQQIVELLNVSPSIASSDLIVSHKLNLHLTPQACQSISNEFNIPIEWLNGESNWVAERYGKSLWRNAAEVATLISDLLERYSSVSFNMVLPDDISNPFPRDFEAPLVEDVKTSTEIPILVYYKARGKYGEVFGHLGIQPWNIKHHRKAAIFLGTILRDLNVFDIASVSVMWSKWPKERILATASDTLLSEAVHQRQYPILDVTDSIFIKDGCWFFLDREYLQEEFNEKYAPIVRDGVEQGRKSRLQKDVVSELIAELTARYLLPEPLQGNARVFGFEACRIATACGSDVSYVDENGRIDKCTVYDAGKLIEAQQNLVGAEGLPMQIVFLDVCVADSVQVGKSSFLDRKD